MKSQLILFVAVLFLVGLMVGPDKYGKLKKKAGSLKGALIKSPNQNPSGGNGGGNFGNNGVFSGNGDVFGNANINRGGQIQDVYTPPPLNPDKATQDLRLRDGNVRGLLGKSNAYIQLYNKGIFNSGYGKIWVHITSYNAYGEYLGERKEQLSNVVCKGNTIKERLEVSRDTDEIVCVILKAAPTYCGESGLKRRQRDSYYKQQAELAAYPAGYNDRRYSKNLDRRARDIESAREKEANRLTKEAELKLREQRKLEERAYKERERLASQKEAEWERENRKRDRKTRKVKDRNRDRDNYRGNDKRDSYRENCNCSSCRKQRNSQNSKQQDRYDDSYDDRYRDAPPPRSTTEVCPKCNLRH